MEFRIREQLGDEVEDLKERVTGLKSHMDHIVSVVRDRVVVFSSAARFRLFLRVLLRSLSHFLLRCPFIFASVYSIYLTTDVDDSSPARTWLTHQKI